MTQTQKFAAILYGPNPGDGPVTREFDMPAPQLWEYVWVDVEAAAKTLGWSGVSVMRAVEPLSSAWLTQHLFDEHARQSAHKRAYTLEN